MHVAHGSFNPRARAGRDPAAAGGSVWRFWFQSTRPRGARRMPRPLPPHQRPSFNPTPARGATVPLLPFPGLSKFQSTRPRGARPDCAAVTASARFVSIRARAGRDSGCTSSYQTSIFLFQSTRPRGARLNPWIFSLDAQKFQSTRPRGARLVEWRGSSHGALFQSTRPRGARRAIRHSPTSPARRFNPRARAGRDTFLGHDYGELPLFQSTRPRGARPDIRQLVDVARAGFNPRARAGRDIMLQRAEADTRKFQSTRPRGAARRT